MLIIINDYYSLNNCCQISKSIGDAYLKRSEFQVDPSLQEFQFPGPLREPAISAEPFTHSRPLKPGDRFFIFASHGSWEHLTNQRAADIVYNNPRSVCICFLFFSLCLLSLPLGVKKLSVSFSYCMPCFLIS